MSKSDISELFSRYTPEMTREVFGKGSSSVKASLIVNRDKKAGTNVYGEMRRVAAFRDGLISEAQVPMHERISREELQAHYAAENANNSQDVFVIPAQLAESMGLPIGSTTTASKLRALMGKATVQ